MLYSSPVGRGRGRVDGRATFAVLLGSLYRSITYTSMVYDMYSSPVSLGKTLFHFKALLWESIILVLPPLTCKACPIAVLLRDHCALYAPPPTPPFLCHTPYNIGDDNII